MSMPRPNVPDRLIEQVESLHEDRQGYRAGSFQEALATTIDLATPELVEAVPLFVAKAYPADSGLNVARLHRNTLQQLDVAPGRFVEIQGERTTVVTAKELKRTDLDPATVRLDGFGRENAAVDVGECVRVERAEGVSYADLVMFELSDRGIEELGTGASGVVGRQVTDRVVSTGDVVPVVADPNGGGRAIPLSVLETEPGAPVVIDEATEVVLARPDRA